MEKVETIKHLNLNQEEIKLACLLINGYGCGQHPFADTKNYVGFAISYVKELVEKFRNAKAEEELTEAGKETLASLEKKVNEYVTI